ncbi:MAG TPA: hypothetical protein DDY78_25340 [Planctomycetales bacterium]|jgi:hydrogenase maturation protease|nr:hypothetical protein [Planctomycetales bacterium]
MNRAQVARIADAVLYEGYILYPYRPSVKNRQRWTFGGLYPESYSRAQAGADAWSNQTECLVHGDHATTVEAVVRFLHLTARVVGVVEPPLADWTTDGPPSYRPVDVLRVGEGLYHSWQEAEEREVVLDSLPIKDILDRPHRQKFMFRGRSWFEPLRESDGKVVGVLAREQQAVEGEIEATAAAVGEGLFRLTLCVLNRTPLDGTGGADRDDVLLRTLVSTHILLGVRGGEFVSLLEPPDEWREAAAACRNVGVWPVLAGEAGSKDVMLSSPIILYDYPQVAPESQGDFFDGGEIDEILTLRILTLTDEEKGAMAAVDGRARELLARTESLGGEEMSRLHGAMRVVRPFEGDNRHDGLEPGS